MSDSLVPGFELAGVSCGIKTVAGKEDLTLVHCLRPAVAAGVYTQNLVVAAPVILDRQRTPSDNIRVVVVNSGNANACTGERGLRDAEDMARLAAQAVGASPEQALVMSTGIIGEYLPMAKITAGIDNAKDKLGATAEHFAAASRGILTTDNGPKTASRAVLSNEGAFKLMGFCKGAGMIGPNMATMLGVILTDARLTPDDAQRALKGAVDESFNCISVEGHTSTNDTVLLLASGAASPHPLEGESLASFATALTDLCIELAKMIPDDGEGASHLIAIEVRGCATVEDARRIAKTIANSNLVKAGVAGADPNWGRVLSAAGYSGVTFDPRKVSLFMNGAQLFHEGEPAPFDAAVVSASIRNSRETHLLLELGEGSAAARFWTSDLTPDYVRFNSAYHT